MPASRAAISCASPSGQYFCHRLIRSESLCQKQLVQIKTWAFAEIVDPSMFGPGRMYVTLVHALLLIFLYFYNWPVRIWPMEMNSSAALFGGRERRGNYFDAQEKSGIS